MIAKAPAKINLALDVIGLDAPREMHLLRTVYAEVPELFDELDVCLLSGQQIEILCDHPDVPTGDENLVYQAAKMLQENFKVSKGARIKIHKKIPIKGGLGGASSDAVAVLKVLNQAWNLNLDTRHLLSLASHLGADCAFFVEGGVAIGTHYGERLEQLPPLPEELKIEIIETGIGVSTQEAFSWLELGECGKDTDLTDTLIEGIRRGDTAAILENLHNDLEGPVLARLAELRAHKTSARKISETFLAGSGGCFFMAKTRIM